VFVGSDLGVADYVGATTVVVDLNARMLMPGFHDGHARVLAGGLSLEGCNLNDELLRLEVSMSVLLMRE
jgi:predicted amidohydrolase YtcJ